MTDFKQWSEKRKEITTPENYSNLEAFNAIAAGFGDVKNVTELNAELKEMGDLWDVIKGKKQGYHYPSVGHPNFTELESRLKALEVGNLSHPEYFSCLVFPRGMAAICATLEALAGDGAFIHHSVMYPTTKDVLKASEACGVNSVGSRQGIEVNLKKLDQLEHVLKTEKVLGVVLEPVANPTLDFIDIRKVAEVAHEYGVPVIVDNTFLTPYLLEPFRLGADIVIHSLTKYYCGQGDMVGGAVIMPNEYFADIKRVRKNKGFTMSPRDAFTFAQRVGAVGERMELHCKNARELADALSTAKEVSVNYTHLEDKTRNSYAGGVLSFNLLGVHPDDTQTHMRGIKFGNYVCRNPGVIKQAVSFGEPKTLILPWAGQIEREYLIEKNIPLGLVRVGVGREEDFSKVIAYIKKGIEEST